MIKFSEMKKFFIFNMIGSLIICALIAVVAVLVGGFNDVLTKALVTLFMVTLHSLICLAFIWDDEKQNTFERLSFFINVLFILIVASFITSIFGIWDLVSGRTIGHIYATYGVLLFAALHGDILSKALNKENYIDMIVYVNYLFMMVVVIMMQPIIYISNKSILGDIYFRILGAVGIIDGTLSILTIIFYKLYMNSHPKIDNPLANNVPGQQKSEKKGFSIWVWILIIYLSFQIISLFSFSFFRLFR
jgi:hypothetical protein